MSPTSVFFMATFGVLLMAGLTSSQILTCRGMQYDRFTHICCRGVVLPIARHIQPINAMCCNGDVMDNSTMGCCAGQNIFDRFDQLCCEGKVTTDGGPLTHTCCGDNTFVKAEMKMCCQRNVVNGNPMVDLCCEHETVERAKYRCCNDHQKYDFRDAVCCNRRLQQYPGGETQWQCCGTTVFRKASSVQACCGDSVYDPRTHYCCGSRSISLQSTIYGCCNVTGTQRHFDVGSQSCCKADTTVMPGTVCPDVLAREAQKKLEARQAAEAKAAAARTSVAEVANLAAEERARVASMQKAAAVRAAVANAWQQARAAVAAQQKAAAAAHVSGAQKVAQQVPTSPRAPATGAGVAVGQKSAAQMVYPVMGGGAALYATAAPKVIPVASAAPVTSGAKPVMSSEGYAAWMVQWQRWAAAYMAYQQKQQQPPQQQPGARQVPSYGYQNAG